MHCSKCGLEDEEVAKFCIQCAAPLASCSKCGSANPARAEYDNPHVADLLTNELETNQPDIVHAVHGMKLSAAPQQVPWEPSARERGLPSRP